MLLEGRNCFVTGGSRGLGRDAVIQLAAEGANVAFTYVKNGNAAEETIALARQTAGRPDAKLLCYQLDVKDSKQVEAVAAKAIDDLGGVHVVVNNAGNLNDALIVNMTDEQWFDVINTHLSGTFFVCREFLNEFIYNKGGKFVNVSSITHTGSSGQANYSAAKSGIIGFTKALAKEYGGKKIYCNVVVPGYFDTELVRSHATEQITNFFVQFSTLKRKGEGSEYAKAVVFLASDYSSFVNGAVLHVTGGLEYIP